MPIGGSRSTTLSTRCSYILPSLRSRGAHTDSVHGLGCQTKHVPAMAAAIIRAARLMSPISHTPLTCFEIIVADQCHHLLTRTCQV